MMPAWELREHLKDRDASIVILGNEVSRLTAEVERLRAALRAAYNEVDLDAMDDNHELQRQLSKIANIASAALSPPATQEKTDDRP